jgi:DNA mismatch endonuclease, patch repair protein
MADVHDKATRSYNMSRIRSKNTKPELIVRSFLHKNGFRFRVHDRKLPGRPDIVLKKLKTVIFIHGCFWHTHKNCKYSFMPSSRIDYWKPKLEYNNLKDRRDAKDLKKVGWRVLIVWECQLKKSKAEASLKNLLQEI